MGINSKSSLIKFLEECRDSHKLWAEKIKAKRVPSVGSQAWNVNIIKEYQEAVDFIKKKLRRVA